MTDFSPNQRALARMLLSHPEEVLSGSFLSEKLGISRQAVSKNIHLLRKTGFPVFSLERKGYGLLSEKDSLHPLLLEWEIQHVVPSGKVWCFTSLSSTQSVLKELAKKGAPEGSLVLGETQTAGRGRTTRSWSSPPGKGLYFSVLLRPSLPPGHVQLLNLVAGVAVSRGIKECTSLTCDLKWPNDVLYRNKKICGILSEAASDSDSIRYAVVGIGVNVNTPNAAFPPTIRGTALSLFDILGRPLSRKTLLLAIYRNFMKEYHSIISVRAKAFLDSYRTFCSTLGKEISLFSQGEPLQGKAQDVTEEGSLILLVDGEKRIFHSGDVCHLR